MTGTERRHIGTLSATLMLVGMVVGVSIFILPGQLAATAGPGVLVSYLIASVVALVGCLVAGQVGAVLPVTGASYVLLRRCVSPFAAFLSLWLVLGASCMAMALLAYGFADYFALLVPGLPARGVAVTSVLALGALNFLGTRTALLSQSIFVVAMIVALFGFCAVGVFHVDRANLDPFLPRGVAPVLSAAVPAFFSFTGFSLITEIGGEVKDPARTIPRSLIAAFAVVLVTYLSVAFVVVGVENWSTLGNTAAPLGALARQFLPGWGAGAIAVTAILATVTSLNAILLGYARDLLALARADLLPARFARLNAGGEPYWAIALMTALSLAAILAGATVLQYATVVVVAAMLVQMVLAIAVWRVPIVLKQEFAAAEFKLPRRLWHPVIGGLFLSSAYLAWIGGRDSPRLLGALAAFALVGAAYYGGRTLWLRPRA